MKSQFKIMQLDFKETWSKELSDEIEQTNVFVAADGKHKKIHRNLEHISMTVVCSN